jgi:hypothetical protein
MASVAGPCESFQPVTERIPKVRPGPVIWLVGFDGGPWGTIMRLWYFMLKVMLDHLAVTLSATHKQRATKIGKSLSTH